MEYAIREDWLAQVKEPVLDPERIIVDPHHHFFAIRESFQKYDLAKLRADCAGHRVQQTVYLQCGEGYRETGPEALKPVGETEWVDAIAERARQDPDAPQIGAIVGTAELRLGAAVREVEVEDPPVIGIDDRISGHRADDLPLLAVAAHRYFVAVSPAKQMHHQVEVVFGHHERDTLVDRIRRDRDLLEVIQCKKDRTHVVE